MVHDVRFELFSDEQFLELSAFRKRTGENWRRVTADHDILVFDPVRSAALVRDLRGAGGYRQVFESDLVTIVVRR